MSRVPELLEAAAALPAQTQAIEHLVHSVGLPPDAVATRLRMPLTDVRAHLQAARDARHALAKEREHNPIVHHESCTWGAVVEARGGRDDTIMGMLAEGFRPHQVAARMGLSVHIIYHTMSARRQQDPKVRAAARAKGSKNKASKPV